MSDQAHNHARPTPMSDEAFAEAVALFVAGALSPEEQRAFEQSLLVALFHQRRQLSRDAAVLDALATATPALTPPPGIKSALMARVHADAQARIGSPSDEQTPFLTLRTDAGHWTDLAPGVQARTLLDDRSINRVTMLIRMEPGADYPDHHHDGLEECYVIEGSLNIAGTVLAKGDYQRCLPHTDHGRSFSTTGCLLLITIARQAA